MADTSARHGGAAGKRRWWKAALLLGMIGAVAMPAQAANRRSAHHAPAHRRATARVKAPELAYTVQEGRNLNAFLRDGPVAAHLVARDGADPRLIVAFPAGNSGTAVWFAPTAAPVAWRLLGAPRAITRSDARGRPLRGMEARLAVRADRLAVRQTVLSNIRIIRDVEYGVIPPVVVLANPTMSGDTLAWARDRMDGAAGYALDLAVEKGRLVDGEIRPAADGEIVLRVTALTGDTPLTPFTLPTLLKPTAAPDPAARRALAFLSYHEKFLAGSWRFDTYFGRDTLMSLRLLMPALRAPAVEAGLGAVLARISPEGEAAHEEGLSEYALLDAAAHGRALSATPTLDYAMVDTSLMLAPVLGDYLASPDGKARAKAFLASPVATQSPATPAGRAGDLLMRNLRWVWQQTGAFAARPVAANLIALKDGHMTGQWRDSDEGLARGRYAYDVNAVLAPAALRAAADLCARGLLNPYLTQPGDAAICGSAQGRANLWQVGAPALFEVRLSQDEARKRAMAYAAAIKVDGRAAAQSIGPEGLAFHALSLDAAGKPIPVLHSDEDFALLFGRPAPEALARLVANAMRPFPAGLMTEAGLLIANPAYAPGEVQGRFGAGAYHGTVVWSWQQAMLAAGLDRQLARTDLPAPLRAQLVAARAQLWKAIEATRAFANSELWSWSYGVGPDGRGRFSPTAYGAQNGDADESNAAQLWSTVYLGLRHPR